MTTISSRNGDLTPMWTKILFLTLFVIQVRSEWWSMASSKTNLRQAANVKIPCSEIRSLSRSQRTLCESYRDHLKFVSEGAKDGIAECQYQLQNRRWNCTTVHNSNGTFYSERSVFGKVIDIGSRESAFTYAISSAAVVHKIARACKEGSLSNCGCSKEPRPRALGPTWEWGGCGDNTLYAYGFAREFIDARERDPKSPLSATKYKGRRSMNIHNNEVGRLAIVRGARPTCRCHGVSGSCSVNTCWLRSPDFRKVGDLLRSKFDTAVEVKMTRRRGLKNRRRGGANPTDSQLVFLESSPDYCDPNPATGVFGTKGRYCIKNSHDPDGCDSLCCGRKFISYTEVIKKKCNCKFQWCCSVQCETCTETVERHVCT